MSAENTSTENENHNENVDTQAQQVCHTCKDFLLNSSVHGFRFFVEPKRHWMERVWWVVSCISSMILCAIAIIIIWTKWHEHPVTVTFDDKTTPIAMIPFPAVTVCTTQKYKENINITNDDTRYPPSLFSDDINQLDAASQICAKGFYQYWRHTAPIPPNQTIYEAIEEISPNKSLVIGGSIWASSRMFANFSPVFTEEGLCFTVNSLNSEELYAEEVASELKTVRDNPSTANWNIEDGYQSSVTESTVYPYRVFGAGLKDALRVFPRILLDETFRLCGYVAPGFLITLHLSDELPAEQNAIISVKPNMIATSEGLRSYKPHVRNCYFKSERQLRFFKSYSQSKCEIECLANFTRTEFGCVRFYMPRNKNTKICRQEDIDYINFVERNFTTHSMVRRCGCLPDCFSLAFDIETSQVPFDQSKRDEQRRIQDKVFGFKAYSDISILFKENQFISLNRSETFTMTDFIASCGGLFGLFMGISMLSVVELIYYFTLRMCCKWRRTQQIQGDSQTTTTSTTKKTNAWAAHNRF